MEKQQIYTYNGEPAGFEKVYVLLCDGVPVVKRRSDGWMNATQILGVAGWTGLERQKKMQKLRQSEFDEHQTLKGAGIERGTWIPLDAAIRLAKEYFVYDSLKPILEYEATMGDPPDAPTEMLRLLRSGRPRQSSTATDVKSSSATKSSRSPSPSFSSPLSSPPPSPSSPQRRSLRPSKPSSRFSRPRSASNAVIRTYPARCVRVSQPRQGKASDGDSSADAPPPRKRARHSEPAKLESPPAPIARTIVKARVDLAGFSRSRGYNL